MSDSTTLEGWVEVVKHWMDGGEVEWKYDGCHDKSNATWEMCPTHAAEWSRQSHIFRIKPDVVPKVGDVWETCCIKEIVAGSQYSGFYKGMIYQTEKHDNEMWYSLILEDGGLEHTHRKGLSKYIGKIDLSILTGKDKR